MQESAITRLEKSRRELLDLGLRNPLINHRRRAKQINILNGDPSEIYQALVTDSQKMVFTALAKTDIGEKEFIENDRSDTENAINWDALESQLEEDSTEEILVKDHLGKELQTNLDSSKLQTTLLSIHNDARTYIAEQGVNILYLAIGFLYWHEAPSANEPRRAPLLLIPIELGRANAKKRFQVSYTGEEIGENLSLSEKLKAEFDIELPKPSGNEILDVATYLDSVAKSISNKDGWLVNPDEITLGFFSFGKFLMYKDLEPENWLETTRGFGMSILESLLTDGFKGSNNYLSDEENIDEVILPGDLHQVKDADSTQILAILDVNAGRNLVIQGPPGTGKSQTITNIISESIGNGKKVLFVSEKMAALDVVKRRLDEVGLGDAVLELHSHKSQKKQVLNAISSTLNIKSFGENFQEGEIEILALYRDELNEYCDAIDRPIGNTNTNFVNALGNLLKIQIEESLQPLPFKEMDAWSELDYRTARMIVEKMDSHLAEAGSPNSNCFRFSKLTDFSPSRRPNLEKALERGLGDTAALIAAAKELTQLMGLQAPQKMEEVEKLCRAGRLTIEAPCLFDIVLDSSVWRERRQDAVALVASGKFLSQAHSRYDERVMEKAWDQNLTDISRTYRGMGRKWWRFMSITYRRARARLHGLFKQSIPNENNEILEVISTIINCQKHQERFNQLSEIGPLLFGTRWQGPDSDWDSLKKLTDWVIIFYKKIDEDLLPESVFSLLRRTHCQADLTDKVNHLESCLKESLNSLEVVVDFLQLNLENGTINFWEATLANQLFYFELWRNNIDSLYNLVNYRQLLGHLIKKGMAFLVDAIKDFDCNRSSLLKLFDYSWYNGLVEKGYQSTHVIKHFDRSQHTHKIEKFRQLDHSLFRYNQVRLILQHRNSLLRLGSCKEINVINREIHKKRRHMPIRSLMEEAGRVIQIIKPIFMMGPLSVATYIPPASVHFDLVIFDEASQVKPVEAFGSILRGDQVVVVGDSKQLPPTSFFDSLTDADEEDYENVGDMESILTLFLAKGAPERMLRWHYRSRHESLIAMSNFEFYDSRLMVFPSCGFNYAAMGLRLHHMPNTVYDRGKTSSNPGEAEAVAEAIMNHARTNADLSLGVVAFSTVQRDAIEFQLELLRQRDPSCENFFNEYDREHFFIKNLENVQGDERDVIFISIGYGKTDNGYLSMNFGPLNREGGERRLNVLITRSRLAMHVFTNFSADDMDLNRSKARGVITLKNFLAFAKTRILQQPYTTGRERESPFEEAVYMALVKNGIEVEPQVGTSGFFIDLAVKAPENPGKYILGIECDGASYHSSRSARDRDRLRQEVLEGLGWRLYRIWSTEWYRNPQKELERALDAIKLAENAYDSELRAHSQQFVIHETTGKELEQLPRGDGSSQGPSVPYKQAKISIFLGNLQFHEMQPLQLLPSIVKVVEQESPIHVTELIRRITEAAGLKRSGSRIQDAIKNAIAHGEPEKHIRRKGDFFWIPTMIIPEVRDRSNFNLSVKKIEFVAPEEIREAIHKAVQFGNSRDRVSVISSAARMLGFQRVTEKANKLFNRQLEQLVKDKTLSLSNDQFSIS